MRVIIVGIGRMGFTLARELDTEGHEVTLIDPRHDRVEVAQTRLDVMTIEGSGCSRDVLTEANAEGADLLLAVSGSDEVNVVSCLLARSLGVKRRIARIESRSLVRDAHDLRTVLGIDEFVAPRQVAIERLQSIISVPGTTEAAEFAGGKVVLRAMRVEVDSDLTAQPLSALRGRFPQNFLVAAVRRNDSLVVPTGAFQIRKGDVIYVVIHAELLDDFLVWFKLHRPGNRRVVVYSATDIGLELAHRLSLEKYDVVVVDERESACELAAERLGRCAVIHGSPLDSELMLDLKVKDSTFFGVADSVESNFAAAVAARRLGARRSVMLAEEPDQVAVFDYPLIDAVVNPIALSVGAILRSVREGRVVLLFRLAGGSAEALEIVAQPGAAGTLKPLSELSFPSGAVVAAVTGSSGPRVARGETVIHPGDHVIVVALCAMVHEIVALFSAPDGAVSAAIDDVSAPADGEPAADAPAPGDAR
jgi:trk system potassium uptake protein TrkA